MSKCRLNFTVLSGNVIGKGIALVSFVDFARIVRSKCVIAESTHSSQPCTETWVTKGVKWAFNIWTFTGSRAHFNDNKMIISSVQQHKLPEKASSLNRSSCRLELHNTNCLCVSLKRVSRWFNGCGFLSLKRTSKRFCIARNCWPRSFKAVSKFEIFWRQKKCLSTLSQ